MTIYKLPKADREDFDEDKGVRDMAIMRLFTF